MLRLVLGDLFAEKKNRKNAEVKTEKPPTNFTVNAEKWAEKKG